MLVNKDTIATLTKAIFEEITSPENAPGEAHGAALVLELDSKITLIKTFDGSPAYTDDNSYTVFVNGVEVGGLAIVTAGICMESVKVAVTRFVSALIAPKVEEILSFIVSEQSYISGYKAGKLQIWHGHVGQHLIPTFQVELDGKLLANVPGDKVVFPNSKIWNMLRPFIKQAVLDGDIEVLILE